MIKVLNGWVSPKSMRNLFVLVPLLWLAGCAGTLERPKIPAVIAPEAKVGNYTVNNFKDDLTAYDKAAGAVQMALRNKMVYSIAAEIDYAFYNYETKLFLNEGNFHVATDFLQLGLAAGSTVAGGARTKTILSALLTGVTGLDLSIDKNFFRQQTVQAISSSMESNRDRIKTSILLQLKLDTTAYPFAAARADLIHYFFAGTLNAGLQQMGQDAATNAQTQKATLNSVQTASFSAVDVLCLDKINQAVAKAFAANASGPVISLLQTMGTTIAANASQDDVLSALRTLGAKITADPDLRAKYCSAAKQANFIQ